jgi:hypothetical protein
VLCILWKLKSRKLKVRNTSYSNSHFFLAITAAIAAGLYPLTYLYKSNHTLVASWYQFFSLVLIFIALPVLIFLSTLWFLKKTTVFKTYSLQILSFLNFSVFSALLIYGAYGVKKKILLIAFVLALVAALLLFKYLKKIILFQFLLAAVGLIFLIPTLLKYFSYSNEWQKQPDHIESIKLNHKPNIYVIQPDGYIGLSELGRGNYNKNNDDFNMFLLDHKFKLYPNYRSNYYSTLSSNSSMFAMKHHYYNRKAQVGSELLFARDIIISENPVLSILKNNNYTTSLILENSYLLTSRPKLGYDFSNINYSDLPLVSRGFEFKKDVIKDLESKIESNKEGNHFYFIERISPGHIATLKSSSEGKEIERIKYLEHLDEANSWLMETVTLINKNDPEALIIIVADHGGFVGYEYSGSSHEKPKNRANTFSMFSSLLAIKWPKDVNVFDNDLKSSVNLFRTVFSVLSGDKSLLDNLQSDESYLTVNEGAPLGIYEVIDENNNMVFKQFLED